MVDGCPLSYSFKGKSEFLERPQEAAYQYVCKRCFPPKEDKEDEESVPSEIESSSSDATGV